MRFTLPAPAAMLGAAGVGAALQTGLALAPERSADRLVYALVAFLAGTASLGHVRQARESRGRLRLGWSFTAVAAGMWGLGNLLWLLVPSFAPTNTKLSPADMIVTMGAVFAPGALMLCSPAAGGLPARVRRLIDGATIAAALSCLCWQLVLRDVMPRVHPDSRDAVVAVLAGEILAAAYGVVVLSRALPREGVAITLYATALAGLSIFTMLDTANLVLERPRFGHGVGGGYLAVALLLAACSRAPLPTSATWAEVAQPGPWQALPYVPVVLAFATAARQQIVEGHVDAVSFWVLLSMAVLVLVRQFVQLRVNLALMRKIDRQRQDLAHQATHDPLTGLGNRTALTAHADALFEPPGRTVGVLLLDLDGFKPINDTYGHAAGDRLLCVVADRVRAELRHDDLAVRLGGDEFVILLAGFADAADATEIGERILHSMRTPADIGPVSVPILASAGLAVAATSGTTFEALLHDADVALYTAKGSGKSRLCVADTPVTSPTP